MQRKRHAGHDSHVVWLGRPRRERSGRAAATSKWPQQRASASLQTYVVHMRCGTKQATNTHIGAGRGRSGVGVERELKQPDVGGGQSPLQQPSHNLRHNLRRVVVPACGQRRAGERGERVHREDPHLGGRVQRLRYVEEAEAVLVCQPRPLPERRVGAEVAPAVAAPAVAAPAEAAPAEAAPAEALPAEAAPAEAAPAPSSTQRRRPHYRPRPPSPPAPRSAAAQPPRSCSAAPAPNHPPRPRPP